MDLFGPVGMPLQYREPPAIIMPATENRYPELIKALIRKESVGDLYAIGDKHLVNKAYGPLQIRQPAVDDVNRVYATHHKAEDCLGNLELSIRIFHRYMEIYATEARLGRPVTDEDRARIWNGGPSGWKRRSTVAYWRDVHNKLLAIREASKLANPIG